MAHDDAVALAKIWPRIVRIVQRDGIPHYVAKWHPLKKTTPRTLIEANRILRAYHPHTRLWAPPKDVGAVKKSTATNIEALVRKPPTFHFDPDTRIGTITLFTFAHVGLTQAQFEAAGDRLVQLLREQLDAWEVNGMRGLILDFRKHYGGSYYPLLRGFARFLVGVPLFAWVRDLKLASSRLASGVASRLDSTRKVWSVLRHVDDKYPVDGKHSGSLALAKPYDNGMMKIALILGPETYSSGEIGAAMFAGKEGVCSFGRGPTGGGLTPNQEYNVGAGGFTLNLTCRLTVLADGTFDRHERLVPDVKCKSDPLKEAKRWLLAGQKK